MVKEKLLNFLTDNFEDELRNDDVESIVDLCWENEKYLSDHFENNIRRSEFIFLLYILFKKFNFDILNKIVKLNDYSWNTSKSLSITDLAEDLNKELTGSDIITIDINHESIDNSFYIGSENPCKVKVTFSNDIDEFSEKFNMTIHSNINSNIILPENLEKLFIIDKHFNISEFNTKFYFTPVMRDGELTTKFPILNALKPEYLKLLRPISSLEESLDPDDDKEIVEMFKDKFYKYSGLDKGNKITQEKVKEERLRALGRISFESGYSVDYIEESLLK